MPFEGSELSLGRKLAFFALTMSAGGYIAAMFSAVGVSINFQVNGNALPSSVSQFHYSALLTMMRVLTFLFGNLLGDLTDMWGRKPMMIAAIFAYIPVFGLMLVSWNMRPTSGFCASKLTAPSVYNLTLNATGSVNDAQAAYDAIMNCTPVAPTQMIVLYYLAFFICGVMSPYQPHAVGYVQDISPPNEVAANQGSLLGGYFAGLMLGAVVAIVLAATPNFITLSLIAAGAMDLFGTIVLIFMLKESIPDEVRAKKKGVDWVNASPLGVFTLAARDPYNVCVFGMLFWARFGSGATEASFLYWMLHMYSEELGGATRALPIVMGYLVVTWLLSGIGSTFLTPLYKRFLGLKNSYHALFFPSFISAILITNNPSFVMVWICNAMNFIYAGPMAAILFALIMGQGKPEERGLFSGAVRSGEALGKFCGSLVMAPIGAAFYASGGKSSGNFYLVNLFGFVIPLLMTQLCFLIGEFFFSEHDLGLWKGEDEQDKSFFVRNDVKQAIKA